MYGWGGLRDRKMHMRQGHGKASGTRYTVLAFSSEKHLDQHGCLVGLARGLMCGVSEVIFEGV